MPTTVNSRFMAIGSNEPNINSGWTIKVLDYKDGKTLVGVISEFTEMSFTQELNGTGQGSITLDADSPWFQLLLRPGYLNTQIMENEYVFEAWDNNIPRFSWLGQTITDDPVNEDEVRHVTISGPGIAQVLTWAVVCRPGWPTKVPIIGYEPSQADPTKKIPKYRVSANSDKLSAAKWEFPMSWSTMRMWYTVFRAAQRRGLLGQVRPMFTYLADSGKQKWQVIQVLEELARGYGYQPEDPNQNLLDFLNDCTGQDYTKWFGQRLEWMMYPGFKLDVRPTIGTDRSKNVRFWPGNTVSVERTRDREAIYNRITVQDVLGDETIVSDKSSISRWNLREQFNLSYKEVENDYLRGQIANRVLLQSKDEKDQWTIKIRADDPGRIPYRDFFVGDKIGVNAEFHADIPTSVGGPDVYRVMAITIRVTADSVIPECELTLKSLIDSQMDVIQKKITELIYKPTQKSLADLSDVVLHANATNDGKILTYNAATGKWEAGDAATTSGTTGGGARYVQKIDPATQAGVTLNPGDFWLETYD